MNSVVFDTVWFLKRIKSRGFREFYTLCGVGTKLGPLTGPSFGPHLNPYLMPLFSFFFSSFFNDGLFVVKEKYEWINSRSIGFKNNNFTENSIKVKEQHFSASKVRHRLLTLTNNKYSWTLKIMIYPLFQHKYRPVSA